MNLVEMDKKLDILLHRAYHLAYDYYAKQTLDSLLRIGEGLKSTVSYK